MATIAVRRSRARLWQDYLSLAKPRVILSHLITASAAMFLGCNGLPPPSTLLFTLLGGGLAAASANALNCYLDRDIDRIMRRTRCRPLAAGRINPAHALAFGVAAGLAGLLILSRMVNAAAAVLAALAMIYYILCYTFWLKRRTVWSSIIGSGAGAFPPLIGWVAVNSQLQATPLLLAAIIVLWTPPHFWSLTSALHKDYEAAGVMTPERHTTFWIACFSFLLAGASLGLAPAARLGAIYTIAAGLLASGLLTLSLRLMLDKNARPQTLYWYSIIYLATLFGAMIADRLIAFLTG